jgi:hypothetical protein
VDICIVVYPVLYRGTPHCEPSYEATKHPVIGLFAYETEVATYCRRRLGISCLCSELLPFLLLVSIYTYSTQDITSIDPLSLGIKLPLLRWQYTRRESAGVFPAPL